MRSTRGHSRNQILATTAAVAAAVAVTVAECRNQELLVDQNLIVCDSA